MYRLKSVCVRLAEFDQGSVFPKCHSTATFRVSDCHVEFRNYCLRMSRYVFVYVYVSLMPCRFGSRLLSFIVYFWVLLRASLFCVWVLVSLPLFVPWRVSLLPCLFGCALVCPYLCLLVCSVCWLALLARVCDCWPVLFGSLFYLLVCLGCPCVRLLVCSICWYVLLPSLLVCVLVVFAKCCFLQFSNVAC